MGTTIEEPLIKHKTLREQLREERELLKARVSHLKKNGLLPSDWRDRVYRLDSSYNTGKGTLYISNVHALRATDKYVTELLEKVAREYSQQNSK